MLALPPLNWTVTMSIKSITDYDIQALVDGELPETKARKVQEFIESNRSAQKRYQQLCKQHDLLKLWWQDISQN